MSNYLHAPLASKRMPRGIPYIIGNEAAERFSFYGMRAILVVFMTQYLMRNAPVRRKPRWAGLKGNTCCPLPSLKSSPTKRL